MKRGTRARRWRYWVWDIRRRHHFLNDLTWTNIYLPIIERSNIWIRVSKKGALSLWLKKIRSLYTLLSYVLVALCLLLFNFILFSGKAKDDFSWMKRKLDSCSRRKIFTFELRLYHVQQNKQSKRNKFLVSLLQNVFWYCATIISRDITRVLGRTSDVTRVLGGTSWCKFLV